MVFGALGVALAGLVAGAPSVSAELPELQSCTVAAETAVGDTGPDVSCLQFTLAMMGYSVPYTGTFDRATADAVRWFQATTPGLTPDGRAGDLTLRALQIDVTSTKTVFTPTLPPPPLCLADAQIDPNERGQSVTCLQRRLTELGLYSASITGLHDRSSVDAVRAYQQATPPLKVDGRAGAQTLASLGIWSGTTSGNGRNTGPGPFPAPVQEEPFWNLTARGIPFYGSRTACNPSEAAVIAAEFANDGADSATQQWAVYIASREGGCRFDAININPRTRDDSHCTFQLNALARMFEPTAVLGRRGWTPESVKTSIQACADAASDLWVYCGRGPWLPPYSCAPPWAGAGNGQRPPVLPEPVLPEPAVPESVLPEPVAEPGPADSMPPNETVLAVADPETSVPSPPVGDAPATPAASVTTSTAPAGG